MGPDVMSAVPAAAVIPAICYLVAGLVNQLAERLKDRPVPDQVLPLVSIGVGGLLGAVPLFETTVLVGLGMGLTAVGIDAVGTKLSRGLGVTHRKKRERSTDATVQPVGKR